MADVNLQNINKHYGDLQVLFDVSLNIKEGEFVVFVGPSGCGKSTLLRTIAGLEDISSGSTWIGDTMVNDVAPADRGVAMVFQSYALYPHMSVRANMEFGLKINNLNSEERKRRIEEAARILQLTDYLDRKPGQLSGGQRQRVAIGRAIVKKPLVFLFDEPLSNLDAALRVQMRVELETLHNTLGSTMIYVTHDQVEAMTMADRIVVLNEGRTEQIGSPLELYHQPNTLFVAGFIGSPKMNFLSVDLEKNENNNLTLKYESNKSFNCQGFELTRSNKKLTFGIRPEHLSVSNSENPDFRATVKAIESLGSDTYIHSVLTHGESFIIRAQGDIKVERDKTIGIEYNRGDEHLFDQEGIALKRLI